MPSTICLIGLIGYYLVRCVTKFGFFLLKLLQLMDIELCEQFPLIPKPYTVNLDYFHQFIFQAYVKFRNI